MDAGGGGGGGGGGSNIGVNAGSDGSRGCNSDDLGDDSGCGETDSDNDSMIV